MWRRKRPRRRSFCSGELDVATSDMLAWQRAMILYTVPKGSHGGCEVRATDSTRRRKLRSPLAGDDPATSRGR